MRPIFAAFRLFPLLLLLMACRQEAEQPTWPERERPRVADQTVLFHLSGQSLYTYFKNYNIPDIRRAIDQHILYDSRLLVYAQPSTYHSYLVEYSFDYDTQTSRADTLRRYEGMNSIQTESIVRVIRDVVELAPANRYGMVLGSHGAGWVPAIYESLRDSEDSEEDDLWQSLARPSTDWHDWLYKSPGAEATRWFGEHDGETTDIASWAEAFRQVATDGTPLMEYLIFDACLMSNIEALYELRHAARYILASPCEIMGRGMPYDRTLPYLFTEEGKGYDLQGFAEAFVDFYATTTETRQSGCLALCCCEELEPLAEMTRRIHEGDTQPVDRWALQNYEGLIRPLFQDFRQYIELLSADPALLAEFEEQFDRTFPPALRLHTPEFYSGYNATMNPIHYYSGVSTSALSDKFPTAYASTPWALAVQPSH